MIDEHATAMLALLTAAITSPRKVFDGEADANIDVNLTPYVLAYFDSADPEFDKEANAWRFETTGTLHCVGGNAQAARQMADLARTALLAVRPTVAGRSCFPITRELGAPPQRDESTGVLVFDQIDTYTLRSLPG